MERYLGYYTDEGLSIVPSNILNHADLSFVREDGRDKWDTSARNEWSVDQMFPRWRATVQKKPVRPTTCGPEWILTSRAIFVTLLMIEGVGEHPDPSSVGSMPTGRL